MNRQARFFGHDEWHSCGAVTFHDGFVCKDNITREVRALPVEE